jgi:hypothetical protein
MNARVRVSPQEATIGDVLHYEIRGGYAAGGTGGTQHPVFDAGPCTLLAPPQPITDGWGYRIACFRTGAIELPLPAGIALKPAVAHIHSVLAGQEQPELRPPKPLLPSPAAGLWGAAALTLALLGAFLLYRRFFAGRRPTPSLSPHERALAALAGLQQQRLIEQGRYADYVVAISAVVRQYTEERFGLHAPEQTTEEFLHDLTHQAGWTPSQRERLQQFLQQCDLVKFAQHSLSRDEARVLYEYAEAFIRQPTAASGDGRL